MPLEISLQVGPKSMITELYFKFNRTLRHYTLAHNALYPIVSGTNFRVAVCVLLTPNSIIPTCLLTQNDRDQTHFKKRDYKITGYMSDRLLDSNTRSVCRTKMIISGRSNNEGNTTVFIRNHENKYRCFICDNRPYEPLSKAIRHEGSKLHTDKVRRIDRNGPLSSPPPVVDELPEVQDEQYMLRTGHGIGWSRAQDSRTGVDGTPRDDRTSATQKSLHVAQHAEYGYGTTHGPALPGDSADQLYDDWGGDLAYIDEEAMPEVSYDSEEGMHTFNDDLNPSEHDPSIQQDEEEYVGQSELVDEWEKVYVRDGSDSEDGSGLLLGPENAAGELDSFAGVQGFI